MEEITTKSKERMFDTIVNVIIYILLVTLLLIETLAINQSEDNNSLPFHLFILVPWIPGAIIVPHEIFYKTRPINETSNPLMLMLKGLCGILFFPVIIIIFLLKSLRETDTGFTSRVNKINCINQVMLGSINLTLLMFMLFRGYLNV